MEQRLLIIDKKSADMSPISLDLEFLKLLDRFFDRLRGNTMLLVIGQLLLAAPAHFIQGTFHGSGLFIGIQNDPAIDVSSSSAADLDKRRVTPEKTFFVGIHHSDQ